MELDDAYMSKAATVAGQQLAKAGFRLASNLVNWYTDPKLCFGAMTLDFSRHKPGYLNS